MAKERKIPVFPNWFPFNDMVFDGHLQIGEFAVKTRCWNWDYRGPVLFYTSLRVAWRAVDAYGYRRNSSVHKVINGIANIVLARELTNKEGKIMVCNFNNITPRKLMNEIKHTGFEDSPDWPFWFNSQWGWQNFISPFRIGFFFKNQKRFEVPIPFNWPSGPIKPIFIDVNKNPALKKQIALAGY